MMSFKEFQADRSAKVAGPQQELNSKNINVPTTPSHLPSSVSTMQEEQQLTLCKAFPFIDDTYRDLKRFISGLYKDSLSSQLIHTINKYKNGCNEIYEKVLESYDLSYKLAQNIARTMDIFKELSTCHSDMEEYNFRLCEIMSIFIVFELRLSVDAAQNEQLSIAHRIIYIMRRHLVREEENETIFNILKTLVYIPKLFNARELICAIFGEFIPLKPVPEVNVFSDKLYMLYIIVFYRWMMMQKEGDDKLLIVNFAENFMKPSVSLCTNKLYGAYLPMYTTHSTATRTILNDLIYYRNIRNASIIDNALKPIGAVVNLCDDDEDDDIVVVGTSLVTDFAQMFASARLETLSDNMSNVKLVEDPINTVASLRERHDKWLNEFKELALRYRELQLLSQTQQNIQLISSGEKGTIISLDSDSEEEEEISAALSKEILPAAATPNQESTTEDLFVDNYPLTNTPLHYNHDLESFEAYEDANDVTKISPMFLSGTLRTYQAKNSSLLATEIKNLNNSGGDSQNTSQESDKHYRRDSIHISSTPPEETQNEDDEGTDVQDEHDDLMDSEKEKFLKQIRPMGPYPTYNSIYNDKVVFSQTTTRYPLQKSPKKQTKRVHFNTNPIGPTASSATLITPLKSAIQQRKYKVLDAPEYCNLRSNEDAASTTSSTKQQDHLEAAALFFRQTNRGQFSPSISSVSSRPLTSPPGTSSKERKKSHVPKNKKIVGRPRRPTMGTREDFSNGSKTERRHSIIRNREMLSDTPDCRDISSYGKSSNDYCGVTSHSGIILNDDKLRKHCVVVIEHSKELIQYNQRKRYKMYNEILEKQRRKLELRTLEKRKEKEQTKLNSKGSALALNDKPIMHITRKYNEFYMSSEYDCETNFELRTRKPRQQNFKELEPLNIQIERSESNSTSLLSQIESHWEKTESEKILKFEAKDHANKNDVNQQPYDTNCDKSPTKMRELNLLADIAQHLPPYQLDLPESNHPPITPSPAIDAPLTPLQPAARTSNDKGVPKEKITITEQLIIQSLDNLLEKRKLQLDNTDQQQQQASTSYAHEPKLNIAPTFKSSHCGANLLQNESQQYNTQLENNDNNFRLSSERKEKNPQEQTDDTLEQILDESISVLKYVTIPYIPSNNDCTPTPQETHSNSTIPILISNVESLNQSEMTDVKTKQKSDNKIRTSKNFALTENGIINKETNEKAKDFLEEQHNGRNESAANSYSNILNSVETSIKCASDLSNVPNEIETSRTLKITSLMEADLSNISLGSEMPKNLPETAVTDMSDNSNESDVSKTVALHIPIHNNSTRSTNTTRSNEIPLAMSNISQPSMLPTDQVLESSFNELNFSVNKTADGMSKAEDPTNNSHDNRIFAPERPDSNSDKVCQLSDSCIRRKFFPQERTPVTNSIGAVTTTTTTNNSTNDLNTPIKFGVETYFESGNILLKTSVEPQTDTNVTKFLDLILNKTVTDAETRIRDRIIKELNALTADTAEASETPENNDHKEINTPVSKLNEKESNTKIPTAAETKTVEKKILIEDNAAVLNGASNLTTDTNKSHKSLEYNFLAQQNDSQTLSANNEINPPKDNLKEDHKQTFSNTSTGDLTAVLSSSPSTEMKSHAIKCRVRLKRLMVDDHSRIAKNEYWMTIPITNPVIEPVSSNTDITKCDNATEKTLPNKKQSLKHNNKHSNNEKQNKIIDIPIAADIIATKKPKLEADKSVVMDATQTSTSQQVFTQPMLTRDSLVSNHKQKLSKSNAAGNAAGASSCYLKSSTPSRKLPDNTLRAAETLQIFVNKINDSARTPPPAEFNKKRNPIKNKCIAEDETPRPPTASTLMGTPPCKKTCIEKSPSQITNAKCKDQLVSSLTTASISSIASDIITERIYTSSPLDQTLPAYDDNVNTVADPELILPNTSGSLRRKLKRPKKSMPRPEPVGDIHADDISNQPECNAEDDTDAVVDNEDDVFAEELLPIPAANENILEEIVSARPSHVSSGSVIRDDYMNIEATATVPVYLFNDESRDLGSPELIQSSDTNGVVDSSSYLKTASSTATNNIVAAAPPSTTSAIGNLEKSMLSPSEHEVSSTQETFYKTPTKNKQTEILGEKSAASKEKGNGSSGSSTGNVSKQKAEDNTVNNKKEYQISSNIGLLQNNQVDTTNHSPEMYTLTLAATTLTTTTTLASNRKICKVSTHDEILFNELQQQQLPSNKRKSMTTFCVESTSDNKNNAISKTKVEEIKSSLAKVDDKIKKLLKEVCKKDKTKTTNELDMAVVSANSTAGGSSPSTTTTINEGKSARSKRKKLKSSKSSKTSKLTPHIPANPLIITIPKSRLLKPYSTPPTAIDSKEEQEESEFLDMINSKLFIEKGENTISTATQNINNQYSHHTEQLIFTTEKDVIADPAAVITKSKSSQSFGNNPTEFVQPAKTVDSNMVEDNKYNINSTTGSKEKSSSSSSSALTPKKKEKKTKIKTGNNTTFSTIGSSNNDNLIFVKDKYDSIKSKSKNRSYYQDQQYTKEKSKDKTDSQSKPENNRSHKSSVKGKIKGEKSKERRRKYTETTTSANPQTNVTPANSKIVTFAPIIEMTSLSNVSANDPKYSKSRNNSFASSTASLSTPSILKSKTNLRTTQSAAAAATVVSSQITTARPSTNNK